jgi:hypothetical protein
LQPLVDGVRSPRTHRFAQFCLRRVVATGWFVANLVSTDAVIDMLARPGGRASCRRRVRVKVSVNGRLAPSIDDSKQPFARHGHRGASDPTWPRRARFAVESRWQLRRFPGDVAPPTADPTTKRAVDFLES